MAHLRHRHIFKQIEKLINFSPIVGILGHRQVGKTTILEDLTRHFITMDTKSEYDAATSEPDSFVDRFTQFPVGIDECQLCPPLFAALKDRVRRVKRPGQFVLTGSVRFSSRKIIKESLTGRIVNVNLHPLMVSELMEFEEPKILRKLLTDVSLNLENLAEGLKSPDRSIKEASKALLKSCTTGGLPGVCFVRDTALRAQKLESQLETILTRDLRLIIETTLSYERVRTVLAYFAKNQGQPLDFANLARRTRVSIPALRRLISAFEALFLIYLIPCSGDEKRPAVFMEDAGEAHHLADGQPDHLLQWSSTLAGQVRSIFDLPLSGDGAIAHFSQYRNRGGAFVPFVVHLGKNKLGIIPTLSSIPSPQELGSARSFLSSTTPPGAICRVIIATPEGVPRALSRNLYSIPAGFLML